MQGISVCLEVVECMYECVEKLVTNQSIKNKIMRDEMVKYIELSLILEVLWLFETEIKWKSFESIKPNLQRIAIRISSLTCSATGCERTKVISKCK